jgi:hypothetical protein
MTSHHYCGDCKGLGPFGSSLRGPYCLQCGHRNIWPLQPPPGPPPSPQPGTHPAWSGPERAK